MISAFDHQKAAKPLLGMTMGQVSYFEIGIPTLTPLLLQGGFSFPHPILVGTRPESYSYLSFFFFLIYRIYQKLSFIKLKLIKYIYFKF